jgi:hypothetical protein
MNEHVWLTQTDIEHAGGQLLGRRLAYGQTERIDLLAEVARHVIECGLGTPLLLEEFSTCSRATSISTRPSTSPGASVLPQALFRRRFANISAPELQAGGGRLCRRVPHVLSRHPRRHRGKCRELDAREPRLPAGFTKSVRGNAALPGSQRADTPGVFRNGEGKGSFYDRMAGFELWHVR